MALDASEILHQPGELIWAATDVSIASPMGGTSLGYTDDGVRLRDRQGRVVLKGEESGERILDVVYTDTEVILAVTLLQWNDTNLARAFPGGLTATGATSGEKVIQYPGTLVPGTKLSSGSGGVLVFAPLDLTNNKLLLARKAIPLQDETAELALRLKDSTKLRLLFYCIEDTAIASSNARYNSRILAIGDRRDLSVS